MYERQPIPDYEFEFWRIVRESLSDLRQYGDRVIAAHQLDQMDPNWRETCGLPRSMLTD